MGAGTTIVLAPPAAAWWCPCLARRGGVEWAMGAIGYVAARELRRSRRTVLALTLLVAVGGAIVLTLAAGARRANTSYQRFRTETLSADVSVAPSEFDPEIF